MGDAILWHEGMLLAPQHFQQAFLRQDALLAYHLARVAPWPWGVVELSIDDDLLLQGWIEIQSLEAVLPDGLVVGLDGDSAPLRFDLGGVKADLDGAESLPLWLTVPERRRGVPSMRGDKARWRQVEGDPVADEATGEGEIGIPRLEPRLSLAVSAEPPVGTTALPLARVAALESKFVLARYEPPRLAVAPGSRLWEVARDVCQRLWSKAKFLAETRSGQGLEERLRVGALVGDLPRAETLLRSGRAHPFDLYLALCGLVGPLALLRSEEPLPPEVPAYRHEDPLACYEALRDAVARVLDEGISEAYEDHRFEYAEKNGLGYFYLRLQREWLGRDLLIGVRRRSGSDTEDAAAWMASALVGAESQMATIRDNRVLGVEREQVGRKGDLSPTRSVLLFELATPSKYLVADEFLMVYAPRRDLATPRELVLYVESAPAASAADGEDGVRG